MKQQQKSLDGFNRGFDKLTDRYVGLLNYIALENWLQYVLWLAFGAGIIAIASNLPSGFIPSEDQGMIYAIIQTPPGSTLERTNDVSLFKLQKSAEEIEGIKSVSALAGYEVLTEGRGSNAGTCLINLKPWNEREQSVAEVIEELEAKAKAIPGATIEFFDPQAVPGYGAAGGFALQLLDKTNSGDYNQLERCEERVHGSAAKSVKRSPVCLPSSARTILSTSWRSTTSWLCRKVYRSVMR